LNAVNDLQLNKYTASSKRPHTIEEKIMRTHYTDNRSKVQQRASNLLDKTKWLPELYKRASAFDPELLEEHKAESFCVSGQVLAWLDLAEPNEDADFGYEATRFLVQRIARRGLEEERLKSSKPAASYVDIDVIESIFDAVFGEHQCSRELRAFVCNVLGVLGLVRFTEGGEPIPTRVLRKLVSVCRQEARYLRTRRQTEDGTTAGKVDVEQWLAIRKEAGPRIDPEVAEVASWHAYIIDPYGVCSNLPKEAQCFGRQWFARSPRSDVWVFCEDLPTATQEALSEPNGRRNRGKGKRKTAKTSRSKKSLQ
jgi:hypothetical protein